jgi:alginate O-acetyltransferase complex protein AlgI
MIGWVLFRADSLSHAYSLLKIMLRFGDIPKAVFILDPVYFNNEAFFIMALGIMGTMPIGRKIKASYLNFIGNDGISNIFLNAEKVVFSLSSVLYLLFLLVVSTIFLASGTYNPFIYFRF